MEYQDIVDLIDANLADFSDILPAEHRAVEIALLNYIHSKPSIKVLNLDLFTTDRNYSVPTGLVAGRTITGVVVMLECKTANNGFAVGDIITAPTPYPVDSGRTSAQGIGVQYNNSQPDTVKVMTNDQITIMTPYNDVANAIANNIIISGAATGNWKIKLYVTYIN
jgi:hypothetical protein